MIAATYRGTAFSWGKNDHGQLGLGHENRQQLVPQMVSLNPKTERVIAVACGHAHSMAIINLIAPDATERKVVFVWGDGSRGQLGSANHNLRAKPQENRWVTRLMGSADLTVRQLSAGAFHNLALVSCGDGPGSVIAWGAGAYGQLGNGFLWDVPQPFLVNGLKDVTGVSAGLRHSAALMNRNGATEVAMWGYNSYGELGLGDTDLRIIPTVITALNAAKVFQVSAGDRHTLLRTSHKPILAKEDAQLRPFYDIIEGVSPCIAFMGEKRVPPYATVSYGRVPCS